MQRRDVLVLTTSFPRFPGDPAGHFVAAEVKQLLDLGCKVRVLAGGCGNALGPSAPHDLQWLGAPEVFTSPGALHRIKSNPFRLPRLIFALARALLLTSRAPERSVVAHWLIPFGLLAASAKRLGGASFQLEVVAHGSDVRLLLKLPGPVASWVVTYMKKAGAKLRFVSEELKRDLSSLSTLPLDTWTWLQGAEVRMPALLLPSVPEREEARRILLIAPGSNLVVIVGRLIPSKRIDVALRAITLLPNATIVVVGDGPKLPQMRALFPQARFVGAVPHPTALLWIRAADLLVSASLLEGAPTVVREARILGTPAVAIGAGDTALWAETDDELWLVPAPSASA